MTALGPPPARVPVRAPHPAPARRGYGHGHGHGRGGPLVMLAVLLGGWGMARAVWWENPFAGLAAPLEEVSELLAAAPASPPGLQAADPGTGAGLRGWGQQAAGPGRFASLAAASGRPGAQRWAARGDPRLAAAHPMLWHAALRDPLGRLAGAGGEGRYGAEGASGRGGWREAAPFLPAPAAGSVGGRWSLDAWAYWRQGSDAAPVSQGRVPIYGASQAGAVLQYRLAPEGRRDPRLYARAYRALIDGGESELALGASLRPVPRVPLRLAGEVRYTDAALSNDWRPAAYVVTEIAPVDLPHGTRLEAYGQAGWVGGAGATAFADGQASVTGEVERIARLSDNAVRLSIGAAAWGGAQKDAQRIDIGPTVRLDFAVGSVPARASLDWRERIGGTAAPDSGLAATVSTQF